MILKRMLFYRFLPRSCRHSVCKKRKYSHPIQHHTIHHGQAVRNASNESNEVGCTAGSNFILQHSVCHSKNTVF
jgi:hypothetical protein